MTDSEQRKAILDQSAELWNAWFDYFHNHTLGGQKFGREKPPAANSNDNQDFCNAIHTIQRIICAQELKEQKPGFFK